MKYNIAFLLLFFGLLLLALVSISFSLHRIRKGIEIAGNQKGHSSNWLVKWFIGCFAVFILIALVAPYFLTTDFFIQTFEPHGGVGDTIGGLMNPFIGIAGVFVTGLAFYMQYEANDLQRTQFREQIKHQEDQARIQQFEAQFYEMLRLHRENVAEMRIEGYDYESTLNLVNKTYGLEKFDKITEGRKVFVTMVTELEAIVEIFKMHWELNRFCFQQAYRVFFNGLDLFQLQQPSAHLISMELNKAQKQHKPSTKKQYGSDLTYTRKKFGNAMLNFNYKPFSGHSSRLGHYFRHLFLTVKLVANTQVFKGTEAEVYEKRMNYMKLIRAQLSDHEQVLLFYNWLAGYGTSWQNSQNMFFTEYKMIHNVKASELLHDEYIQTEIDYLERVVAQYRKGPLFEQA